MTSLRRTTCLLLAATGALVPLLAAAPVSAATPPVKVALIRYDPPGSDRGDNASLNAEYIVLKNVSSVARVITGYRIRDVAGHSYVLGPTRLLPGGTVTLHTGRATDTPTHRYWKQANYVWNNTKDTAYLISSTGTLVHQCSYPDTTAQSKAC